MSLTDAALAAEVAHEAGELLLAVREELGFYDPYDLGDAGDKRANVLILDRLKRDRPDDAVLSEEAVDDLSRVRADRVWIVDPVDGTREFSLPGHEDWAVHIALWQRDGGPDGGITDAVVGLPARGEVYRTDTVTAPPPRGDGPIRIAASANRPPAVLWRMQRADGHPGGAASARRAPRRWPWCAATSTPTSTPVASGSGIRPRPQAWCAPRAARLAAGRLPADLQPA